MKTIFIHLLHFAACILFVGLFCSIVLITIFYFLDLPIAMLFCVSIEFAIAQIILTGKL